MLHRTPTLSWAQFSKELQLRFWNNSTSNYYEAWGATRQTGTIEDEEYVSQFAHASQVTNLKEEHYLGQFRNNLKQEIRHHIREDTIMDEFVAIRWARQIERELLFVAGEWADRGQGRSAPSIDGSE